VQLDHALARILQATLTPPSLSLLRVALNLPPFVLSAQAHFAARAPDLPVEDAVAILDAFHKEWIQNVSQTPFVGALVPFISGFASGALFSSSSSFVAGRFSPSDFRLGVKLRAGVEVSAHLPDRCSCGCPLSGVAPMIVNSHILNCPHNFHATSTTRHTLVNKTLCRLLQRFGLSVTPEPTFLSPNLRPDAIVCTSVPIIYDLSFVDEVSGSHRASSNDPLDERAFAKHTKYDSLANANQVRFFPVILSVYGTVHREVQAFTSTVCRELPHGRRALFARHFFVALQQASAVGSAAIVRNFVNRVAFNRSSSWSAV
jgi:hypothetical protein